MHWRTTAKFAKNRLEPSPYPKYDTPLVMEGNATVIPDLELPFHSSDFVNRILDLSQAWGIEQAILAGDMLHFNSLSSWEANWQTPNGKGGLDDKQEAKFSEFIQRLPAKYQSSGFDLMEEIGMKKEDGDPNISEELRIARKATQSIADCFKNVDIIIGNHEGRLLRALDTPLFPTEITNLVKRQDWRIAPYYFCELISGGEKYRVEHPKGYARMTAITLASKLLCHILMGHSHNLSWNWDLSGNYHAIQMGHCCDELRLPYASQRTTTGPTHLHGAVIVRDGFPWLLHDKSDWERLRRM